MKLVVPSVLSRIAALPKEERQVVDIVVDNSDLQVVVNKAAVDYIAALAAVQEAAYIAAADAGIVADVDRNVPSAALVAEHVVDCGHFAPVAGHVVSLLDLV